MPERWLTELRKIDGVEPSIGLLERAEGGPFLPDPGSRPMARATTVFVAILIAAAGSWGAFVALRGSDGVQGAADGRDGFTALWPETSLADAQQIQAQVDAGDPKVQWRTEAGAVALRYAEEVLGWPAPIAGVTAMDDPDTVGVSLRGPVASCRTAECDEPQPQQIGVSLMLQRLVRPGDGGIWSVTALGPVSEPIGESRPRIGGWPEDADGDGQISDSGDERIPALIRAAGDHGVTGYVRYDDLQGGPQPSNPTEAAAMSGQERVIPVYAADGFTVIDWYTISSGEVSLDSSTPPVPAADGSSVGK